MDDTTDIQALMVAVVTATTVGDDATALALLADMDSHDLHTLIFALCGALFATTTHLANAAGRDPDTFIHHVLTNIGLDVARKQ